MVLNEVNGVVFASFEHISAAHGFSTRLGGVSEGCYESLNLGWKTDDSPLALHENQARFEAAVGFEAPPVLSMVHGADVAVVTARLARRVEGDACVSATCSLSLTTADCVPIFFWDSLSGAVGLAHAGWRGTVAGVAAATVEAMVSELGCTLATLRVGIGPAIGPCCFEVDSEVAAQFEQRFARGEDLLTNRGSKFTVDLWRANQLQLLEAGVHPESVQVGELCTSCRSDLFFSYRRDRGQTGRMLAAIAPVAGIQAASR